MENNCVNGLFTEDQESILTQIIVDVLPPTYNYVTNQHSVFNL